MKKPNHIKKILVVGDMFPDSFAHNVVVTLINMGYEVKTAALNPVTNTDVAYMRILGTYLTRIFPLVESHFMAALARVATDFQPDLVISTKSGLTPSVVERIKNETNARVVCWFTDSVANMDRQYMLAAGYDILFAKEPYMVDLFKNKLGKRTVLLPEACNPLWHKRSDLSNDERAFYGCDINVTGNMYYYRALVLEQLMEYEIKIWGPAYPRWLESPTRALFKKKYIVKEEKAKAFQAAKINLNLLHPTEIYGINCRAFEIAGCGGFQLIDLKDGLDEYFEPDKEVVTFRTLKELKDKIAYYLVHEDERGQIALRSYERAHREHTYEQRLGKLIDIAVAPEGMM
jgi:spore maturation protein CgeB